MAGGRGDGGREGGGIDGGDAARCGGLAAARQLYLHYVLDLWVRQWRQRHAQGNVIVGRYADDLVAGFEHQADAERFLSALRQRLESFALSLHPDQTRLIEFGRFAAENRERRGLGKPESV